MKAWVKGIIAGAVIAAIGVVVLIIGMYMNNWQLVYGAEDNFTMQTVEYKDEAISVIDLDIDAGSVKTEFYEGESIIIDYPVSDRYITEINQDSNVLHLKGPHKKHWWQIVSWNTKEIPDITVKLPQTRQYDISVDLNAGSVTVDDGNYGKVAVNIDAGTFKTGNVNCEDFNVDLDAGVVKAESVVCNRFGAFVDAGTVNIGTVTVLDTDTHIGSLICDISAGLITIDKIISSQTHLWVSAGKITANFAGEKSEYNISVNQSAGSCNVGSSQGSTDKLINIKISAGKAEVNFD